MFFAVSRDWTWAMFSEINDDDDVRSLRWLSWVSQNWCSLSLPIRQDERPNCPTAGRRIRPAAWPACWDRHDHNVIALRVGLYNVQRDIGLRSVRYHCVRLTMSFLPSISIFCELQLVHETGYFLPQQTLEEHWQQVTAAHMTFNFTAELK